MYGASGRSGNPGVCLATRTVPPDPQKNAPVDESTGALWSSRILTNYQPGASWKPHTQFLVGRWNGCAT